MKIVLKDDDELRQLVVEVLDGLVRELMSAASLDTVLTLLGTSGRIDAQVERPHLSYVHEQVDRLNHGFHNWWVHLDHERRKLFAQMVVDRMRGMVDAPYRVRWEHLIEYAEQLEHLSGEPAWKGRGACHGD